MFQKVIDFIKYNNAFSIGIMVLFLGTGMSFAASPDLRNSVYSSSEAVTSIDNHILLGANLDNFNFNLKINSVTEDSANYYINYSYQTLDIINGVWQPTPRAKSLTVNKASLGGKDLGLYVANQLGDNIKYEISYLKQVQNIEKGKGLSQKIITTEYAGLVGKLIDPKEEVIAGYTPVIPVPTPDVASTPKPAVPPDPSLFVENTPGYVKPSQNNPASTPQTGLDEDAIRSIVHDMLLSEQGATPPAAPQVSNGTPVPEPTPTPTPAPESTPTPVTDAPTDSTTTSETTDGTTSPAPTQEVVPDSTLVTP